MAIIPKQSEQLIIQQLFPEFAEESKEYMALVKAASVELAQLFGYIELIPTLFDVERVPTKFIEDLAETLGYDKIGDIPLEYRREILARLLEIYKSRGTHEDVLRMAQRGHSSNYLGGNLYIPSEDSKYPVTALVEYPRDFMFRHSRHYRSSSGFSTKFYYDTEIVFLLNSEEFGIYVNNGEIYLSQNSLSRLYSTPFSVTCTSTGFSVITKDYSIDFSTKEVVDLVSETPTNRLYAILTTNKYPQAKRLLLMVLGYALFLHRTDFLDSSLFNLAVKEPDKTYFLFNNVSSLKTLREEFSLDNQVFSCDLIPIITSVDSFELWRKGVLNKSHTTTNIDTITTQKEVKVIEVISADGVPFDKSLYSLENGNVVWQDTYDNVLTEQNLSTQSKDVLTHMVSLSYAQDPVFPNVLRTPFASLKTSSADFVGENSLVERGSSDTDVIENDRKIKSIIQVKVGDQEISPEKYSLVDSKSIKWLDTSLVNQNTIYYVEYIYSDAFTSDEYEVDTFEGTFTYIPKNRVLVNNTTITLEYDYYYATKTVGNVVYRVSNPLPKEQIKIEYTYLEFDNPDLINLDIFTGKASYTDSSIVDTDQLFVTYRYSDTLSISSNEELIASIGYLIKDSLLKEQMVDFIVNNNVSLTNEDFLTLRHSESSLENRPTIVAVYGDANADKYHYPDPNVYLDGTIMISVSPLTEELKSRILTVLPAGLRPIYRELVSDTLEDITYDIDVTEIFTEKGLFSYGDVRNGYGTPWASPENRPTDFVVLHFDSELYRMDNSVWGE